MKITASDRSALIKLASALPKGSEKRLAILKTIKASEVVAEDLKVAADRYGPLNVSKWKSAEEPEKLRMMADQVTRAYDILSLVKAMSQKMGHESTRSVAQILRPLERLQLDMMS